MSQRIVNPNHQEQSDFNFQGLRTLQKTEITSIKTNNMRFNKPSSLNLTITIAIHIIEPGSHFTEYSTHHHHHTKTEKFKCKNER